MLIKRIEGTTRVLGKSQGFRGLPIRDEVIHEATMGQTPAMCSAWEPTPDEIHRLAAGAPVIVRLLGRDHPPIMVEVGNPPVNSLEGDQS